MAKRHNDFQRDCINGIKKTFPHIKHHLATDIATLSQHKLFPKANWSRVQQSVLDYALEDLRELTLIMGYLQFYDAEGKKRRRTSSKYIDEIFNSTFFHALLARHRENFGTDGQEPSDKAFVYAVQQFVDSLSVMIRAQPQFFSQLLAKSLQPFLELLTTIVNHQESLERKDAVLDDEPKDAVENDDDEKSKKGRPKKKKRYDRYEHFHLKIDPLIDPMQRNKIYG